MCVANTRLVCLGTIVAVIQVRRTWRKVECYNKNDFVEIYFETKSKEVDTKFIEALVWHSWKSTVWGIAQDCAQFNTDAVAVILVLEPVALLVKLAVGPTSTLKEQLQIEHNSTRIQSGSFVSPLVYSRNCCCLHNGGCSPHKCRFHNHWRWTLCHQVPRSYHLRNIPLDLLWNWMNDTTTTRAKARWEAENCPCRQLHTVAKVRD